MGWAEGVTGRANSVWVLAPGGEVALDEKLTAVEAFYARYGIPASYHLVPQVEPALDSLLEQRGYRTEDRTQVALAPLAPLAQRQTEALRSHPCP